MPVLRLGDYRDHILIPGMADVHVFPKIALERIAAGKLLVSETDDFDDWLPTIIQEWLEARG